MVRGSSRDLSRTLKLLQILAHCRAVAATATATSASACAAVAAAAAVLS